MTRGKEAPPALPWWELLEELRLRKGWSRTQLADKAGVARSTVDKWKTSRRSPLNTTVTDVADRLGIDHETALRLAGITPDPEREAPQERLDRLYREWKEDPERRARLAAILEGPAADPGEKEPAQDRLERLWREWRDDPGERGTVLRELLDTWGDRDAG